MVSHLSGPFIFPSAASPTAKSSTSRGVKLTMWCWSSPTLCLLFTLRRLTRFTLVSRSSTVPFKVLTLPSNDLIFWRCVVKLFSNVLTFKRRASTRVSSFWLWALSSRIFMKKAPSVFSTSAKVVMSLVCGWKQNKNTMMMFEKNCTMLPNYMLKKTVMKTIQFQGISSKNGALNQYRSQTHLK